MSPKGGTGDKKSGHSFPVEPPAQPQVHFPAGFLKGRRSGGGSVEPAEAPSRGPSWAKCWDELSWAQDGGVSLEVRAGDPNLEALSPGAGLGIPGGAPIDTA